MKESKYMKMGIKLFIMYFILYKLIIEHFLKTDEILKKTKKQLGCENTNLNDIHLTRCWLIRKKMFTLLEPGGFVKKKLKAFDNT